MQDVLVLCEFVFALLYVCYYVLFVFCLCIIMHICARACCFRDRQIPGSKAEQAEQMRSSKSADSSPPYPGCVYFCVDCVSLKPICQTALYYYDACESMLAQHPFATWRDLPT